MIPPVTVGNKLFKNAPVTAIKKPLPATIESAIAHFAPQR